MIQECIENWAETTAPTNPFPGLRPFEFHENHLFFGRDGQSERLIEKLGRTRFLAVVGTSGSGKSSLARAGLLPALLGGMMPSAGSVWHVALMRPGADPLGNLARALNSRDAFGSDEEENRQLQIAITEAILRRGKLGLVEAVRQANMPATESLLIVADQFEELFRVEPGPRTDALENQKAAFVKLLLEAATQRSLPIYVVLTMRSDYLGDCAQFQDLPEAINESQYLIPRMTRDQRRAAITGPVAVGEGEITPRLVNRLLNDVGDNPDQLPILQHALMRAWDEWKNKKHAHKQDYDEDALDICCYEAIGGMAEALSLHADEAFNELPESRQILAEQIFKGLTEKSHTNHEVRRPLTIDEIRSVTGANETDIVAVVDAFRAAGRSFLTPPVDVALSADSVIDISHESLIRNWKRLREWVDEEAQCAGIYRRLAETAVLHSQGEAGLWRDPDLGIALKWRDQVGPSEAWAQRYHPGFKQAAIFLEASRAARDSEAREKDRQRKRELKRARFFAIFLLLAFVVATSFAVYGITKKWEAETNAAVAKKAEQSALAQKREAEEAQRIAIGEKKRADGEREKAVRSQLAAKQAAEQALRAEERALAQASVAEIARREADDALKDAIEQRKRAEEGEQSYRQSRYANAMNRAFDADKQGNAAIVSNYLDSYLPGTDPTEPSDMRGFDWYYLWRLYHLEMATLNRDQTVRLTTPIFYLGGKRLLVRNTPTSKLWDTEAGREIATLDTSASTTLSVSPNGRRWIVRANNLTKLVDVETGREIATITGQLTPVFSSDSKLLLTRNSEVVKLWDTETGKELRTFQYQGNSLVSASFYRDKQRIYTRDSVGVIKLWEVQTGKEVATIKGHEDKVLLPTLSPTGQWLATVTAERVIKLWDMDKGQELMTFPPITPQIISISFSPKGRLMITRHPSDIYRVWDALTGLELVSFKGYSTNSLAYSLDGQRLVTRGTENTKLWDTMKGLELTILTGHERPIDVVAFSPNSQLLCTRSNEERIVKLWDTQTGRAIATLTGHDSQVAAASFSPDSQRLATRYADNEVILWDTLEGKLLATLKGHDSAPTIVFSPNSEHTEWLLTRSTNSIKRWNAEDGKELPPLKLQDTSVTFVAISPDGQMLATGSAEGLIELWDSLSGEKLTTYNGHYGGLTSLVFSPDNRRLVSIDATRGSKLWDTGARAEGKLTMKEKEAEFSYPAISADSRTLTALISNEKGMNLKRWDIRTQEELPTPVTQTSEAEFLALSPDGRLLVTKGAENSVRVRDVSTGTVKELKGHPVAVEAVYFAQNGRRLVTSSPESDKKTRESTPTLLKLWDVQTGQELHTFKLPFAVETVLLSPDGDRLAIGTEEGSVKLLEASTGAELKTFRNASEVTLTPAAFSANGKLLAILSDDSNNANKVEVWDTVTFKQVARLKEATSTVAFSPDTDSRTIVTISWDNAVKLWDTRTGQELATLVPGSDTSVSDAIFSPDGKTLVIVGDDGTVIKLLYSATEEQVAGQRKSEAK